MGLVRGSLFAITFAAAALLLAFVVRAGSVLRPVPIHYLAVFLALSADRPTLHILHVLRVGVVVVALLEEVSRVHCISQPLPVLQVAVLRLIDLVHQLIWKVFVLKRWLISF